MASEEQNEAQRKLGNGTRNGMLEDHRGNDDGYVAWPEDAEMFEQQLFEQQVEPRIDAVVYTWVKIFNCFLSFHFFLTFFSKL